MKDCWRLMLVVRGKLGSSSVSVQSGDVSMTMSAVGAVSVVSASTGLATRH